MHPKRYFVDHGMRKLISGLLVVWCVLYPHPFHLVFLIHCQAFEFLSGHQLFKKRSYSEHLLDPIGGHLWRMQCFTNEKFDSELLGKSKFGSKYFDDSCELP